jgi:four helix bundle protein
MAAVIRSYKDLVVWQQAVELVVACYSATKIFPSSEVYGLVSQIRRCAASIPANIAEGHGRENTGSFVQFLRIAQGSLKELETHLIVAQRVGYLDVEVRKTLDTQCEDIGKMLRSMVRSLQQRQ